MRTKYVFQLSIESLHPTVWYLENVGAEVLAQDHGCWIEGSMLYGNSLKKLSDAIYDIARAVASIQQGDAPMAEVLALYRPMGPIANCTRVA